MLVADSSVLIALAKIGKLGLLKTVEDEVVIPSAVEVEVIERGSAIGALEVHSIRQAMEEGWLMVTPLSAAQRRLADQLRRRANLGDGELESLILAFSQRMLFVVDDKEARTVAEAMGVKYTGTVGVLFQAFTNRLLSPHELEYYLGRLVTILWLSPTVVADVLREARGEQ